MLLDGAVIGVTSLATGKPEASKLRRFDACAQGERPLLAAETQVFQSCNRAPGRRRTDLLTFRCEEGISSAGRLT